MKLDRLNMRRNWEECPKESGNDARWGVMYATLNREGHIRLSRVTHEAMGAPDSYLLLYDPDNEMIGLKPARLAVHRNAYRAIDRGNYGGKRVNAYRLCREFSIDISETMRFHRCGIDKTGVLILDLNDAQPVRKKKALTKF
ncbi:MAG: hypothetical protein ABI539_05050 [Acidobacteriota bacterium]